MPGLSVSQPECKCKGKGDDIVYRTSMLPERVETQQGNNSGAHSGEDYSETSSEGSHQHPHIPGSWDELD